MTQDQAPAEGADHMEIQYGSDGETGCGCNCTTRTAISETSNDRKPEPQEYFNSGLRPDGSLIDDDNPPSTPLATVMLTNGGQIEFEAVEEAPGRYGIALRELGDAGRLMPITLAGMARSSAAEIFTALCPKSPIPRTIADTAADKPGGKVVDMIDDPIEADLDDLGILPPMQLGSASGGGYGGQFCVPGQGWHDFKNFACDFSGPSNTWFWCDPGAAYYYRQRSTYDNYKRKTSFGITATCGSSAQTVHRYWRLGKWRKAKTWYLPNQYWQWTRYDGLIARNRRVQHISSIQGPPSFVHSVTAIYT